MLEIPIFAERFADFHALDPGQFAQQRRSILRREMPASEQQPERIEQSTAPDPGAVTGAALALAESGRAPGRERVCRTGKISWVAGASKTKQQTQHPKENN